MNEKRLFEEGVLMMASQSEKNVLRTAVMRIMSDMLDDPDEHGIYPTGRFMDRIEALLQSMMAAPEVTQLSGSEAVFGFVGWLTSADEFEYVSTSHAFGPTQDAAPWADLAGRFCDTNHLHQPREQWHTLLTHPKAEAA